MLEPNRIHIDDRLLTAFLGRLRDVFGAIDQEYNRATEHYQFQCDRCTDNCCLTRFYHHTYLEYYYLHMGFKKLAPRKRSEVLLKAKEACRETTKADEKEMPVRVMCPLNADSLCDLYPYRPMICRLHGIPHELRKPGQNVIHGPGCAAFAERCADNQYFRFDRTPYYKEMARLENEFKQALGFTRRIKMTVAEMVLRIEQSA